MINKKKETRFLVGARHPQKQDRDVHAQATEMYTMRSDGDVMTKRRQGEYIDMDRVEVEWRSGDCEQSNGEAGDEFQCASICGSGILARKTNKEEKSSARRMSEGDESKRKYTI